MPARKRFAENVPGLLLRPMNLDTRRIFVAATRMNDGKTTTCLGLTAALQAMGLQVGYIKPIAQRVVMSGEDQVDEDTLLIDGLFDLNVPIAAMSPVAIGPDFTKQYLENPEEIGPQLKDRICRAFDRTAYGKDIVVVEGSGHAGVGSVFGASNADNARVLGSKAIIVAAGGIGKPIDEIALNKALFDKAGVEVVGAILNKVMPDKVDFIRDFAGRGLRRMGVPLLGVVPLQETLVYPNLDQVADETKARWIHQPAGLRRVRRVVIGAMSARRSAEYLRVPGTLVIVPGDREDLLEAFIAGAGTQPLSGVFFSNGLLPDEGIIRRLKEAGIAMAAVEAESFAVTARINNMTVKTMRQDADKIPIIRKMISESVDIPALLRAL
ncbi:MAG: phosphotransacetylase family protein [Verrucomicrobiota bacterium]|jgi:BioD-like phosphotransacetylase family protein